MSNPDMSRRDFMGSLTASAAVGPQAADAVTREAVAMENHPVHVPMPSGGPIRILTSEKFSPEEIALIRQGAPAVEWVEVPGRAGLARRAADAEVIVGAPDRETIAAAKSLKWVQHTAAGVDTLPRELMAHSCVLTNMQRIFAPVIAETAVGMMLSLARGFATIAIPNMKERKWAEEQAGLEDLLGKTLALVGMGGIGSETARRAHYGFGMRVIAVDAKPLPKPDFVDELREAERFMDMVPRADVLMSAAPLTPLTRQMFNEKVFRSMKPTAFFVNVSRGGLVDQDALVRALNGKWIAGAALDVTVPEPLPPENPLWACPNLIITPHNSGYAPVRRVRYVALIAENVRRYSLGLPLLNVVDKARGY